MAKGRDTVASMAKLMTVFDNVGAIKKTIEPWKRYPTEILSLDLAFHGGLPLNTITMLYGDEGTGKSTIAYLIMARAIDRGERVLLLDMEDSLDEEYADKLGLDVHAVDRKGEPLLTVIRAEDGESAWELIRYALESKQFNLIVVDTLAKFVATAMKAADMKAGFIGVDARMNSHAMKVISEALYTSNASFLMLNQVRVDIGAYGAPPTSPGGKAVKHENKLVLKTGSKEIFFDTKGVITGLAFKFTIKKSKVFLASPKAVHQLFIAVNGNQFTIDTGYELYVAAVNMGLFLDSKGKPWVNRVAYFEGEKVEDGEKNIKTFLSQPSELQERIANKVIERLNSGLEVSSETVPADDTGGAEPGDVESSEDAD